MPQFHKLLQNIKESNNSQTYRIENKELNMNLGQFQEEISKASLLVTANFGN